MCVCISLLNLVNKCRTITNITSKQHQSGKTVSDICPNRRAQPIQTQFKSEKPNRCVRTDRNASHRTVIPKQRQQIEYRRHGSPEPFGTTRIDSLILLFTAIKTQNKSIQNGIQTSVD